MRICDAINSCPYLRGYNLEVEEAADKVVLRGVVNSFFHKQMAIETVKKMVGEEIVIIDSLVVR